MGKSKKVGKQASESCNKPSLAGRTEKDSPSLKALEKHRAKKVAVTDDRLARKETCKRREGKKEARAAPAAFVLLPRRLGWVEASRKGRNFQDGVCECGASLILPAFQINWPRRLQKTTGGEAHRLSVLVQKGATGSHEMPRIGDAPTTLQVAVWVVKFCESCDARER